MSLGKEHKLQGIAASSGVVVGRARLLERRRVQVPKRHLTDAEVVPEVARLRKAIDAARAQLQAIREGLAPNESDHLLILDAHVLMLGDKLLVDDTAELIVSEKINAEWALRRTVEQLKEVFNRAEDQYFRERRSDVDFVCERILRQLLGAPQELPRTDDEDGGEGVVLVAHELSPADTASLAGSAVVGFVTDVGSGTSHTAIMARALTIPAVVGVPEATRHIADGDLLVVDGLRGEVTVCPEAATLARSRARGRRYQAFVVRLRDNRHEPAQTRDGVRVALRANIELPAEAPVAHEHGAEGIGLYRTEFLYVDRRTPPDEQEQYEVYVNVVRAVAPSPVTLRTFDIGGDKFSTAFRLPREMNPALGLRAVRLALREREVFRTQLRAMLRAAAEGTVKIMVPMVSTVGELEESRLELSKAREELLQRGIETPEVPLGIMVETPAAVLMADVLAKRSAFFSLGTNDLVQYALAIDRGNEHVASLARPLDPAIVRAIGMTARAARAQGIPCALCGGMARQLMAVPVLVGLGVTELSMEPAAVPVVKEALKRFTLDEAQRVAERALTLEAAEQVEALVHEHFAARFSDLMVGEPGARAESGTWPAATPPAGLASADGKDTVR